MEVRRVREVIQNRRGAREEQEIIRLGIRPGVQDPRAIDTCVYQTYSTPIYRHGEEEDRVPGPGERNAMERFRGPLASCRRNMLTVATHL